MKRIFEVNGSFFETKAEAKVARGDKIADKEGDGFHYAHVVSKGPDHIHFGTRDQTPNAGNGSRKRSKM